MFTASPNPYAPPVSDGPAPPDARRVVGAGGGSEPLARLPALRLGSKQTPWELRLYADGVVVAGPEGEAYRYTPEQIATEFGVTPMGQHVLIMVHEFKLNLRLDSYDAEALRRHVGDGLAQWGRQVALRDTKRSLVWGLVFGFLWFFTEGYLIGALGITALVAGIGRKVAPGRWLFGLAAVRTAVIIAVLVFDVFVLGAPWWLALLAFVFVFGVGLSLRKYRFFSPVQD